MNTKTSNNSLFYRTVAIFMIAMLMLAAMPVKLAQAAPLAAVGVGTDFGAANVAAGTGAMTAITGTYAVGAGANRLLVVVVYWESQGNNQTTSFTSGSYGGQALTSLTLNGSNTTRNRVWIGYLKETGIAAAASTTLNLNFANSVNPNGWAVKAAWFNGIDQTTPINAFVNGGNQAPGGTTHNFGGNLAVINGGRAIYFEGTDQNIFYSAPAGYTANFEANDPSNSMRITAGSKAIAANGNENPTITQNTATRYVVTAISLNPFSNVAPTVTTQAVTGIGATTATGNGNITSLGIPNPTQYGVVWDTAVNPTVALATKTAQGAIAATGAFTSSITGLTPNTLYHVRAYATNTVGTSYGADVTFTTLALTAPTVTTQAVTVIGTTTATGNGNITSLGVPNPTQYGVVWDTAVNPTVALATKTAQGAIAVTGAFTSPITGLVPNTLYHVRAYATNTVGTSYGADVTFTTNQANAITSANNTSFTVGIAGSFIVTATGSPTPTLSISGALPSGVTFTPATGILAGTPAAGTGGIYALTFTAANGVSPDATQSFTLTITDGPSITSANNTSFSLGLPGTFTVTAVGSPAPTLSATGLPAGVTFTPGAPGSGTGTLSTVAAGPVGSYPLTITATNGTLPDATQAFTLTVKNGPGVTPNGINSFPDTGNGSISNNESILDTLGITTFFVKFDQNVYDPAGNTDPKDVTNPANYMLVMGSSTGVFQTVSCLGGVQAPDVAIPISSVSYNNTTFTATVNVSNPVNVIGFYRLYVCGTTSIVDPANINLELAGDGVNPGTDFLINFRLQARATGGGGGNNNNNATSTASTKATLIPVTGFAPNKVTILPKQPVDKAYKSLGEIRIEIPTLGINFPIVGVMFDKNNWDLTWLKDSVAYLDGSAYPTLAGNTVLTAHVRDANKKSWSFLGYQGIAVRPTDLHPRQWTGLYLSGTGEYEDPAIQYFGCLQTRRK